MELPIIANKNDIISYSGNPSSVKFRGYLVEEGYFSNEITTTNNNPSTNFYPAPNSSYLPFDLRQGEYMYRYLNSENGFSFEIPENKLAIVEHSFWDNLNNFSIIRDNQTFNFEAISYLDEDIILKSGDLVVLIQIQMILTIHGLNYSLIP